MGLTSDLTDDEGEVFDDWNDPSRSSLSTFAEDGHVFPFPWDRNVTAIATGMESKLITDAGGPWKSSSPFEYPGTDKILTATLYEDSGGPASWRDATSTSTESSTQHLSVSLGIEVSAPCVSASITGEYSKNVMKNSNGIQASRNASCRVGRVCLDQIPKFSSGAIGLLRQGAKGRQKFRERYGDFYVCAFDLGADAGGCLSAHSSDKTEKERKALTVKVKVMCFSKSKTVETTSTERDSKRDLTFCGFNTLRNTLTAIDVKSSDQFTEESTTISQKINSRKRVEQERALQAEILSCMAFVKTLEADVRAAVKRTGLQNGARYPPSIVPELGHAGVVVAMWLAPFARLPEYIENSPTMLADKLSTETAALAA